MKKHIDRSEKRLEQLEGESRTGREKLSGRVESLEAQVGKKRTRASTNLQEAISECGDHSKRARDELVSKEILARQKLAADVQANVEKSLTLNNAENESRWERFRSQGQALTPNNHCQCGSQQQPHSPYQQQPQQQSVVSPAPQIIIANPFSSPQRGQVPPYQYIPY